MATAFYADYVADLKMRIEDLHANPDAYQTYSLHIDLSARGHVVVYELSRQKGVANSIFYGKADNAAKPVKMAQDAAYRAVEGFLSLGQFLAFNGEGNHLKGDRLRDILTMDAEYPMCAVQFSYRKKGQAKATSTVMILIGFTDDGDAAKYGTEIADGSLLISDRPFAASKVFEWK